MDEEGSVRCWGSNDLKLGDGTTSQKREFVTVSAAGSGVVAIACGAAHACMLMDTGGARCWGLNEDGQVGDTDRLRPVDVYGSSASMGAISLASRNSCAIMGTGTLLPCGDYSHGQVGNGMAASRTTPVDVVDLTGVAPLVVAPSGTPARSRAAGC